MTMKKVYSTKTGKVTWAQPNPARPGEYLMPADATEFPPPTFDDSSRKAKYVNNSWVTEDLTPQEIHEASGSTGTFIGQLDDIGNITLDSVTNGQALIWDAENNKWTNGNVAAGEGGGIGFGGAVLQVKHNPFPTNVVSPSQSWVDAQTVTFTPKSATSKILVMVNYGIGGKGAICLLRNGTPISSQTSGGDSYMFWQTVDQTNSDSNSERQTMSLVIEDQPNTTSAVTYKTQLMGYDQNGICINPAPYRGGNGVFSGMTIWEIDESNNIQNIVDSQTGPPEVYFVASHHRTSTQWYNDQIISPWIEREQQGNSFNSSTGIFTAPKKGLYRFDFFDNFRTGSGGQLYWDWYKNNSNLGYARVYGQHDGGWEGMSGHVILSLEEGDTMHIQITGNGGTDPDGNTYSLFTGYIMNQGANVTISNGTNYDQLDTNASQGPTSLASSSELPSYACRAFCTFDGTDFTTVNGESHCKILGSGNISKVVRHSTGWYRVHFKTPMPDNNYSPSVTGTGSNTSGGFAVLDSQDFGGNGSNTLPQGWFNIRAVSFGSTANLYTDHPRISIQVFR